MATKPQTVLVVEDEASIASFVAAYLKNAGYAVRTTPSGADALKLVSSEKPALASSPTARIPRPTSAPNASRRTPAICVSTWWRRHGAG